MGGGGHYLVRFLNNDTQAPNKNRAPCTLLLEAHSSSEAALPGPAAMSVADAYAQRTSAAVGRGSPTPSHGAQLPPTQSTGLPSVRCLPVHSLVQGILNPAPKKGQW